MSYHQKDDQLTVASPVLPRSPFRVKGASATDGNALAQVRGNHQRLVRVRVGRPWPGVRYVLEEPGARKRRACMRSTLTEPAGLVLRRVFDREER